MSRYFGVKRKSLSHRVLSRMTPSRMEGAIFVKVLSFSYLYFTYLSQVDCQGVATGGVGDEGAFTVAGEVVVAGNVAGRVTNGAAVGVRVAGEVFGEAARCVLEVVSAAEAA